MCKECVGDMYLPLHGALYIITRACIPRTQTNESVRTEIIGKKTGFYFYERKKNR